MKDEPPVVTEPYGDDQAYYDTVDPRTLVKQNAAAIRGRTNIRLLVGGEDGLARPLKAYSDLLDSLKIDHQFVIAPGAHHMWGEDLQPPSLRCSSILEDRLRESAMKLGKTERHPSTL